MYSFTPVAAVAVGIISWWSFSYFRKNSDSSCTLKMKACLRTSSGPVFTENHPQPSRTSLKIGELLVKIQAAAINPVDYKLPKQFLGPVMGLDFSGIVEQVHLNEQSFKVGDEVYGSTRGSLTEYAVCKVGSIALKPIDLSYEEAAALPTAYITGLQGLRDKGSLLENDKVLIIGASGGCGLAGIHLSKALGATEIVGVCSGRNKELVMNQGATRVIDYTAENISDSYPLEYFDLVFDTATGSGGGEDYYEISEKLLKNGQRNKNVILNGGIWTWLSYFIGLEKNNRKLVLTDMNKSDLDVLSELYNSKKILNPVIAQIFSLDSQGVQDGFNLLKSRRTVGKIVFRIG